MRVPVLTRSRAFLGASFFSTFGDVLLVTAVPFGVGVETGGIQVTLTFWLVPALAVLAASLLGGYVHRRAHTARADYTRLLFGIAVLEAVTAVLALRFRGPVSTVLLCTLFVALYAFAKEGIPRLFYTVSVYRYFISSSGYAKLAGRKAGLDIVAALTAALTAAALVDGGTWRYALVVDAATFVVLGATLLVAGRDDVPEEVPRNEPPRADTASLEAPARRALRSGLAAVLVAIPLLHGVNASFINYLPLINEQLGVLSVAASLALLAVLRLPGMVLGLAYDRVQRLVDPTVWVAVLPALYVALALAYLAFPSALAYYAILVVGGLNVGVLAPSDAVLRNHLPHDVLVSYNTLVLRWLGVFQAGACLAVLVILNTAGLDLRLLGLAVVTSVVLALGLLRLHRGHPALQPPVAEVAR